jgi:hypothetical protein
MDTHVAEPTLEDVQHYQARLPGEPDPARQTGAAEPLRTEAPPTAPARKSKRRSGLLSGVAIVAVVVIASGGFLVSPYNTFVPVPVSVKLQVAQLLHRHFGGVQQRVAAASGIPSAPIAHSASAPVVASTAPHADAQQGAHLDVMAPSATLASVTPPPAAPLLKQKPYIPAPPQSEMAELEGLQPQGMGQAAAAPAAVNVQAASPQTSAKPTQVATQAEVVPPGFVPHEPGATAPAPNTTAQPAPTVTAKPFSPSHAPVVEPVTAKGEPAPAVHPQSQAVVRAVPPPIAVATPTEALAAVAKLQAAPMSPPDQVQVLELVTQLATLIRDERTQIANLQADEQNGDKASAAKLGDFERRLALVEANEAMASASNPVPTSPPAPAISPTDVALTSARAALKQASQQAHPQLAAPAAPPATATATTPEVYRVQAASPGLAMLAEVDHSGGDGAQLEVQVGDTIPGYGHVLSVTQQGTNWVVKTDSGLIQ